MPWSLYFAAFSGAFLALLLGRILWSTLQERRAISRWLEERSEAPLRMKKSDGFDMLIYDVDARKANGSETNYRLGIKSSFLTGKVREILEMDRIQPFRDQTE